MPLFLELSAVACNMWPSSVISELAHNAVPHMWAAHKAVFFKAVQERIYNQESICYQSTVCHYYFMLSIKLFALGECEIVV